MPSDRIEFGSVLAKEGSDKKVWLIVIPLILIVAAGVVWAAATVSKADSYRTEAERSQAQVSELQKSIDERDKLLTQARADDGLLRAPGQAAALLFADPKAKEPTESGIVVALPDQKAVRVILYGLVAPPQGEEYVVAARAKDGTRKALGRVMPSADGNGFLLAKDVPEGTVRVDLVLAKAGAEDLADATPRVSARHPTSASERGILVEQPAPAAQARRGRR
ncbi:hypothetical protein [Anaeromyxobacter dehalogenans]|uniref:Uncharacterized protein n=1 Tax=Anaeromyxobacter dehalogenans (strain 2CP-C) TaxID=290397 RepID=Q2IP60_ANADE|nr:hypothetical protein [Anaeromyxobacter dehalogenans]ABC80590.1 hypothetical protein Adeh_0815 [Anaeromyxobacter dehalogenans 2CP-C]